MDAGLHLILALKGGVSLAGRVPILGGSVTDFRVERSKGKRMSCNGEDLSNVGNAKGEFGGWSEVHDQCDSCNLVAYLSDAAEVIQSR